MLKKLFKYDMKQLSKVLFPLLLLTLAVAVLGSAAFKINTEFFGNGRADASLGSLAANAILYLLFGLSCLAIFAIAVVSFVLVMARYYKNFYTDEGYLTFTLPVKTRSLLFSKMWSSALWYLIITLFIAASIFILAAFGGAPAGQFVNKEVIKGIGEIFRYLFTSMPAQGVVCLILTVVCFIAEVFFSTMLIFLAITIGCIVAKKHKVLASIGFVYLLQLAISVISVIFSIIFFSTSIGWMGAGFTMLEASFDSTQAVWASVISLLVFYSAYYILLTVAEFALNNLLMKKKLNLS